MLTQDRTYRTHRPSRVVEIETYELVDGEPVDTLVRFTQEFGRRAGLHRSRSQVTDHRRRHNRRDRRDARRQLRFDHENVELRQPRHRTERLAS